MSSTNTPDEHHFDQLIETLAERAPAPLPRRRRRPWGRWTRNVGVALVAIGLVGCWLLGFQQALVAEGMLGHVWAPALLVQVFVAISIAWVVTSAPVRDAVRTITAPPQPRIDPSYRPRARVSGTTRPGPSPHRW